MGRLTKIEIVVTGQGKKSLKILVLDDEAIVSIDIAMQLEEMGYTVVGPFQDADAALQGLITQMPDFAIIDYNLRRGTTSKPVAEYLIENDIPFSFLSGHSSTGVLAKAGFGHCPAISKPVSPDVLEKTIAKLYPSSVL